MNHSVCDWQSEPWSGARLWPAQVCHSRTPHRAEKGRQGEIHSSNLGELLSLQPSGTEDSPGDIRDVEDDVTAAQLRTLSSITPLFRPHLCLRFGRPLLSSIVADLQVVNGVLQAKVPCNLLKKTTERNVRKPEGSARFDPQSEEWRQIWVDQENER